MIETAHIVVVDDEPDLRAMLEEYLSGHGFRVTAVSGGPALRAALEAAPDPDLVILDVTMPGEDGFSLARHLRQTSRAGIIMLTAVSDTVDKVVGLEIGADDYVTKPFDPRELLARVRSVLRRRRDPPARAPAGAPAPTPWPANATVVVGRCRLDIDARRLTTLDGDPLLLTAMEFELLKAFIDRPNRVLSRDQLLDLAHERDNEPFDRSIDVRITRLRRKIEPDPQNPRFIRTVRGAGYLFAPDGEG